MFRWVLLTSFLALLVLPFTVLSASSDRKPNAMAALKPISVDPKVALVKARAHLKGRGDLLKSELTRVGDKTIQVETFASIDGDIDMASQIIADLDSYPKWILNNINTSPTGDKYVIQFKGLKFEAAKPGRIGIQFALELPVFKHQGLSLVDVKTSRVGDAFAMSATGVPNPEAVIENLSGVMHVFRAEDDSNRLWFFLTGRMKLRPWLLYEALPERLINREAGDRLQILLNNYRAEEDRRHNAKNK